MGLHYLFRGAGDKTGQMILIFGGGPPEQPRLPFMMPVFKVYRTFRKGQQGLKGSAHEAFLVTW